ncbi:MAG: glyoxalase [Marine Group III euryarchaeote CG-Bathy2]|uniref:Glyoxalase n=2 Tax=Methanobacteriati TaxID=3366610 RepID=A0A1J5T6W6_9ARCH|nr:putative glyoxalase [uncultured marine group II/III euryarchaeote KM3_164_G07]OIR11984.1 MAG: glyoxalase [Marine Group III euryarchaeote CG-Bathy2]
MRTHYLGHVVLYVRELERSLAFYRDLLGLREMGSWPGQAAALSSGRTHHEVLLIAAGDAPGPLQGRRLGLYHIGFKVGDSTEELRAARDELVAAGVAIDGTSDHTVTQALYLRDPDGNEVELYVDVSDEWRERPELVMAPIKPLDLGDG